jgi:putative RNA 2'-phosphotransferase
MRRELVRTSRFLSTVLRHDPERFGLTLDEQGWASVPELLEAMERAGRPASPELLAEVVATNDKQRFAFSDDRLRIRAVQGHSIDVDLGLAAVSPPVLLFHGTAERHVSDIRIDGLVKRSRRYVHLSPDDATARKVGQRHGKPVVLIIEARRLSVAGSDFYLSENGVWLTEKVPAEFIQFPE